jgi:hypothetical protein
VDPSGHASISTTFNDGTSSTQISNFDISAYLKEFYGITLRGRWKDHHQEAVELFRSVTLASAALAYHANGKSASETFKSIWKNGLIIEYGGTPSNYFGLTASSGLIYLKGGAITTRLMLHELGHAFEWRMRDYFKGYAGTNNPIELLTKEGIYNRDTFITGAHSNGEYDRNAGQGSGDPENGWAGKNGYRSDSYTDEFQWHPRSMDSDGNTAQEDWADIFQNWALGPQSFAPNSAGTTIYNWADSHMDVWIADASH